MLSNAKNKSLSFIGSNVYKKSKTSFLYSLNNKDHLKPFKAAIHPDKAAYAAYANPVFGPSFGKGDSGLVVYSKKPSWANIGGTYEAPSGYTFGEDNTKALLAGTHKFDPSEVEVFFQL